MVIEEEPEAIPELGGVKSGPQRQAPQFSGPPTRIPYRSELSEAQVKLSALSTLLVDREAELSRLTQAIETTEARGAAVRERWESGLASLREEWSSLHDKVHEARQAEAFAHERREEVAQLDRELEGRRQARESVRAEYARLVEDARSLAEQVGQQEAYNAALRRETETLDHQLSEKQAELAALDVTLAGESADAKAQREAAAEAADLAAAERVGLESAAEGMRERSRDLDAREAKLRQAAQLLDARTQGVDEAAGRIQQAQAALDARERQVADLEELTEQEAKDAQAERTRATAAAEEVALKAAALKEGEAALQRRLKALDEADQRHAATDLHLQAQEGELTRLRQGVEAAAAELGRMHTEFRTQQEQAGETPFEAPQFERLKALLRGETMRRPEDDDDLPDDDEDEEPEPEHEHKTAPRSHHKPHHKKKGR